MKKFIILYHCSREDQMLVSQQSEEVRNKGMALWFGWKEKLGDKLVDFGAPVFGDVRLSADGTEVASELALTGFSIIQAVDFDEAKALVKDHPHFIYGDSCRVEVHEMMDMGM